MTRLTDLALDAFAVVAFHVINGTLTLAERIFARGDA